MVLKKQITNIKLNMYSVHSIYNNLVNYYIEMDQITNIKLRMYIVHSIYQFGKLLYILKRTKCGPVCIVKNWKQIFFFTFEQDYVDETMITWQPNYKKAYEKT